MTEKTTERVTQEWPKELKERVKQHAGQRGMTDFTVAAVEQHLGVAPGFEALTTDLNRTKEFVQTLADKLVLGGDSQDRLQSLVEIEWPDWIDTQGWPQAYADLVHARTVPVPQTGVPQSRAPGTAAPEPRVAQAAPPAEGVAYVDESQIIRVGTQERRPGAGQVVQGEVVEEREAGVPTEPAAALEVRLEVPTAAAPTGKRQDLFAKVMAQTGQDLSDIPGLKPASEIHNHAWVPDEAKVLRCECGAWMDTTQPEFPNGVVRQPGWAPEPTPAQPDPPVESGCPHESVIDGECWDCGAVL